MPYIGLIEFISAQVPFYMRGLMIGMTYCSLFLLGALLAVCINLPFIRINFIPGSLKFWGIGSLSWGF